MNHPNLARVAARENVIRAVGLIIQAEYGWPGEVSGHFSAEGDHEFHRMAEDALDRAVLAYAEALRDAG